MFFNLFRRTPDLKTNAANPGKAVEVTLRQTGRSDVVFATVSELAKVLRAHGVSCRKRKGLLMLSSGVILQPRIVDVINAPEGHWNTITTIEASQLTRFPGGLFEYQHAAAHEPADALRAGFEEFATVDLPVFLESVSGVHRQCTIVTFAPGISPTQLPLPRKVVLGPVVHRASVVESRGGADHAFCPCCFFREMTETLFPHLRESASVGIRFYAARMPSGEVSADCRVNGLDFEEGRQALLAYAARWPERGFEVRKQYVLIHTMT